MMDPSQWPGMQQQLIHIIATRRVLQCRVASGKWHVFGTHFWLLAPGSPPSAIRPTGKHQLRRRDHCCATIKTEGACGAASRVMDLTSKQGDQGASGLERAFVMRNVPLQRVGLIMQPMMQWCICNWCCATEVNRIKPRAWEFKRIFKY